MVDPGCMDKVGGSAGSLTTLGKFLIWDLSCTRRANFKYIRNRRL